GGDPALATRSFVANGYRYTLVTDGVGQTAANRQRVGELAPRVRSLWDEEWRPQMQSDIGQRLGAGYDSMPLAKLVGLLDDLVAQNTLHMSFVMSSNSLIGHNGNAFTNFCKARLGDDAEALANECLQG